MSAKISLGKQQKLNSPQDLINGKKLQKLMSLFYCTSFVLFPCNVGSIWSSMKLIAKRYIIRKAPLILVCCVLEVLILISVCSLLTVLVVNPKFYVHCSLIPGNVETAAVTVETLTLSNNITSIYYKTVSTYVNSAGIDDQRDCKWFGWVPLVIWYVSLITIGSIRIWSCQDLDGVEVQLAPQEIVDSIFEERLSVSSDENEQYETAPRRQEPSMLVDSSAANIIEPLPSYQESEINR